MDSGIGGLNVLAALIERKCASEYIYFSDGIHLPYGDKTREEVRAIALAGAETLRKRGANVVVFGCNTLSVCALDAVRKSFSGPVFGLLPRPELSMGKTLLMTTPTTALYLPRLGSEISLLTPPLLASLIDRHYPSSEPIERYLSPFLTPYADAKTVYLGCSHYAFAKSVVKKAIPNAKITDGTAPLADLIHAVLPEEKVKSQNVEFIFSGANEKYRYASILSSLL